jgi:hypothetical protein
MFGLMIINVDFILILSNLKRAKVTKIIIFVASGFVKAY